MTEAASMLMLEGCKFCDGGLVNYPTLPYPDLFPDLFLFVSLFVSLFLCFFNH